jgi:hypothetical protein
MSESEEDELKNDMGMKFPVITISLSYDDVNEPIHVDLGSVPPFVACSVLESVLSVMKDLSVGPIITFGGEILAEPDDYETFIDFDDFEDDDEEDDD